MTSVKIFISMGTRCHYD